MGKFCLYSDDINHAPCFSLYTFRYSYITDFIQDINRGSCKAYSIPFEIKCLKLTDDASHPLDVNKNTCINCMFCLFGCIGNRIRISDDIKPQTLCVDIDSNEIELLKSAFLSRIFKGSFVKIDSVPYSNLQVKYKNFEYYTSVNETSHIAVWGANAMKYLSKSLEPRLSLETWVDIKTKDRGGRLDISLLNSIHKKIFIAETKVTFESMIKEGRYESQLLSYSDILGQQCPQDYSCNLFLLIGGKETDLLPPDHVECTADCNKALSFYDTLKEHGFFFVSANALLVMGLMKMFVSCDKYNLEFLENYIKDKEHKYLGLLSSGFVTKDGKIEPY